MKHTRALSTVRELLTTARSYREEESIYLPAGKITLQTICLVDPADIYDPDFIPPLAQENDLKYCMMIHSILQILENLEWQIPDPTNEERLEAFTFYVENDAFKCWD